MNVFRKYLQPWGAALLSSAAVSELSRKVYGIPRQFRKTKPVVEVFLDRTDPYSQLLAQVLPDLQRRFSIELKIWQVQGQQSEMFPEPELWQDYACCDARELASLYQLQAPSADDIPEITTTVAAGEARRKELGHYLSAMLWFEGEWFWGLDRLHHLERRLLQAGCQNNSNDSVCFDRTCLDTYNGTASDVADPQEPLIFYFSMRSPYSYLALEKAIDMVRHYQVPLDIRPLLPMVMRGVPVPSQKKMYIFRDTAREARRQKIPYGKVADPLGQGVLNCYALYDYARQHNKGVELLQSYARAVNARGVHSDTEKGLRAIVAEVGLNWNEAQQWLMKDDWQLWAEQHRQELYQLGLWGVPSFRYKGRGCWGQDRLWLVEQWLLG